MYLKKIHTRAYNNNCICSTTECQPRRMPGKDI